MKKIYILVILLFSSLSFGLTFKDGKQVDGSQSNDTSQKATNMQTSKNEGEVKSFNPFDCSKLETEYLRRLEYCINTVKDISPVGYETNPIISDFASMYGVNGRTRMNIHQGVDIIGYANETILAVADGIVLETALAECVGPNELLIMAYLLIIKD